MTLPRGHRVVVGRLEKITRRGLSYYGNPTFDLTVDEVTYRTQTNASVGYEVENFKVGRTVQLTMTAAGRVYGMSYV